MNEKNKVNDNSEEENVFPWTPMSIKISDHRLITQAFRVSLFVHDILLNSDVDDWEPITKSDLNNYPNFHFKNKSIFADEINEEMFKETNILMTYKDINNFAESKNDLPNTSQIVMDISPEVKEIDSDLEIDYRKIKKKREEKDREELIRKAESKSLKLNEFIERNFYKHHRVTMK